MKQRLIYFFNLSSTELSSIWEHSKIALRCCMQATSVGELCRVWLLSAAALHETHRWGNHSPPSSSACFLKAEQAPWKSHGSSAVKPGNSIFSLSLLSSPWNSFFMFGVNKFVRFKHLISSSCLRSLVLTQERPRSSQWTIIRNVWFSQMHQAVTSFHVTPDWSHLGAITPTRGLSSSVTTTLDQLTLLHLGTWFVWIRLHDYLPARGVFNVKVFFQWSVLWFWCAHTIFATACLLQFSGSEKTNTSPVKANRAVMYGDTAVFPTGTDAPQCILHHDREMLNLHF